MFSQFQYAENLKSLVEVEWSLTNVDKFTVYVAVH